jgi:hypothetical protein
LTAAAFSRSRFKIGGVSSTLSANLLSRRLSGLEPIGLGKTAALGASAGARLSRLFAACRSGFAAGPIGQERVEKSVVKVVQPVPPVEVWSRLVSIPGKASFTNHGASTSL